MKRVALTLILTIVSFGLFSQTFEVPSDVKLEKPEDYAAYQTDVINGINWLMETPVNEQTAKRKKVNAFIMQWMIGAPDLVIELNTDIANFSKDNSDLLMIFMGGWAKYSLESKDFKNKISGNIAGIDAVIAFYTKNKALMSKDKNVEKYIKMKEKGTLKEFISKKA